MRPADTCEWALYYQCSWSEMLECYGELWSLMRKNNPLLYSKLAPLRMCLLQCTFSAPRARGWKVFRLKFHKAGLPQLIALRSAMKVQVCDK